MMMIENDRKWTSKPMSKRQMPQSQSDDLPQKIISEASYDNERVVWVGRGLFSDTFLAPVVWTGVTIVSEKPIHCHPVTPSAGHGIGRIRGCGDGLWHLNTCRQREWAEEQTAAQHSSGSQCVYVCDWWTSSSVTQVCLQRHNNRIITCRKHRKTQSDVHAVWQPQYYTGY